jgi:hypothetical protein
MDNLYLEVGTLGAFIGTAYMIFRAIKYPRLWMAARAIYLMIGLLDLYLGGVYCLVLLGILPIPGYGIYVRPVLFPIYMAPVAIDIIRGKIK